MASLDWSALDSTGITFRVPFSAGLTNQADLARSYVGCAWMCMYYVVVYVRGRFMLVAVATHRASSPASPGADKLVIQEEPSCY